LSSVTGTLDDIPVDKNRNDYRPDFESKQTTLIAQIIPIEIYKMFNFAFLIDAREGDNYKPDAITMLQLLRHFAVYTNQKQNHMTYLLTLLKLYEPHPYYSLLPSTGKELLKIDGGDWPITSNETSPQKLPAAIPINDGKYIHFGIENALNGTSVGLTNRDADLIQLSIYTTNSQLFYRKSYAIG
jgi:hypothetical protein